MPIHKEVRENGRVLYLVFTDEWSIHDITESHTIDRDTMDRSPYTIHTMLHMKSKKVPAGLFSMWHSAPILHHPNGGHLLMVNVPLVICAMAKDMFTLSGYNKAHFFDTEDEAWGLIHSLIDEENQAMAAR